VSPLLVRKFREVFSTGAVFVNYRAFLDAMRALHEQDLSPKEVRGWTLLKHDILYKPISAEESTDQSWA
jgi:hypothetical protein